MQVPLFQCPLLEIPPYMASLLLNFRTKVGLRETLLILLWLLMLSAPSHRIRNR